MSHSHHHAVHDSTDTQHDKANSQLPVSLRDSELSNRFDALVAFLEELKATRAAQGMPLLSSLVHSIDWTRVFSRRHLLQATIGLHFRKETPECLAHTTAIRVFNTIREHQYY